MGRQSSSQVEDYSNRVANFFLDSGYHKGDVVGFLMENRPEYFATWLGLAKIGVIPALINTNLRSQSLLNCLKTAKCTGIIYGLELEEGKYQHSTTSLYRYLIKWLHYHFSGEWCPVRSQDNRSLSTFSHQIRVRHAP